MASVFCEQAIEDATRRGSALLKIISPNDVGRTGSYQCGYYLPKEARKLYTPNSPQKGVNSKHELEILWQDGIARTSVVTWYGKSKSEYRLTRFGKDFPFLAQDCVGSLLVLVPQLQRRMTGYVLDFEDDIVDLQAALGVEMLATWAVYDAGRTQTESENRCLEKRFRGFSASLTEFPTTSSFAQEARGALEQCVRDFLSQPCDERLVQCIDAEYRLFKLAERVICQNDIVRLFKSVDDFLKTAQSILQRRKSRAGRSLENHFERELRIHGIPHEIRVEVEGTRPDVLIPSRSAYLDPSYPADKLFAIGVKTTCKDRWTQVLNEAVRIPRKHILTLQQGISAPQLEQMRKASVTLVVPKPIHASFPRDSREVLLSVSGFIEHVKERLR